MQIFSVILGVVVSLTVNSRSSVLADAPLPEGASVTYQQSATTGQLGQMTAGNCAELTLTNWHGVRIQRVELLMHSNQQSGSGSVCMTHGKDVIWQLRQGSFADWCGAFSTQPVRIRHTFSPDLLVSNNISIALAATQNSLYIQSFIIEYEPVPKYPYQVALHTPSRSDSVLSELSVGSGVVLPSLPDYSQAWHFVGWSENEIFDTTAAPELFPAYSIYYPKRDTSLYAVFSDVSKTPIRSVSDARSGYYALGFAQSQSVLQSAADLLGYIPMQKTDWIQQGGVYTSISSLTSKQVYFLDFIDTLVSIRHYSLDTYIGLDKSQLVNDYFTWHYRLLADSTFTFFDPTSNATSPTLYVDFPYTNLKPYGCVENLDQSKVTGRQWILFQLEDPDAEHHWTCYPLVESIENLPLSPSHDGTIIQIGIWKFYIKDGKKHMFLNCIP